MPPKTSRKKQASTAASTATTDAATVTTALAKTTCTICCQTLHPAKDEALFCSGQCQKWLHRYCASVGADAYQSLKANDCQFCCYDCYRRKKDEQLSQLEHTVLELKAEIAKLKSPDRNEETKRTYASATTTHSAANVDVCETSHSGLYTVSQVRPEKVSQPDRKFNVILYGVAECPSGSSRSSRLESDLVSAVSVLSSVESTIQSQSIKDCFRLGKYVPNPTHPRPILITMIRASDASKILPKKHLLAKPHFIKQDMPREQRMIEAVLLNERWKLIKAGKSRNRIRISRGQIFVDKKLYGEVVNAEFHLSTPVQVPASSPGHSSFPQPENSPITVVQNTIESNKSTLHTYTTNLQDTSSCIDTTDNTVLASLSSPASPSASNTDLNVNSSQS